MYQRPQTQRWGAARIRLLRHWRSQTKLRGAACTATPKEQRGAPRRVEPRAPRDPPLTFPRRMRGLFVAVFLFGARTAQGGQEQERE